jgi:hypothetical protein
MNVQNVLVTFLLVQLLLMVQLVWMDIIYQNLKHVLNVYPQVQDVLLLLYSNNVYLLSIQQQLEVKMLVVQHVHKPTIRLIVILVVLHLVVKQNLVQLMEFAHNVHLIL